MSAPSDVAAVILAAGESRRMGSPKALLPYRGQSFLDTLLELFAARCSTVIVVVGAHVNETEFLDLDDPGIIADIDDAEAYRALLGASR